MPASGNTMWERKSSSNCNVLMCQLRCWADQWGITAVISCTTIRVPHGSVALVPSTQVCGDVTHLPMVTPCAHLLCTDCTAVNRTACPVPSCQQQYNMQAKNDPARYKNNPNPKWEVSTDTGSRAPPTRCSSLSVDWCCVGWTCHPFLPACMLQLWLHVVCSLLVIQGQHENLVQRCWAAPC